MLWRKYARAVFMIALHRPMWCGDTEPLSYCLPLDGEIDCAGLKLNRAVGFDLAASPIGSRELEAHIYYSRATPRPRLVDFADGYIWFQPIERYRPAALIPLAEFAPDDAAVEEVAANNPFSDKPDLTRAEIEALWDAQAAKSGDVMAARGWTGLARWRDHCDPQ
jgi:hypothetical protein